MIPIFIGGTGRSGTSILKKSLSYHPQIESISRELRVLVDPHGALDLKNALSDRWSPYNADHAIRNFEKMMLNSSTISLFKRVENKVLPKFNIAPRRYITMGFSKHFGKPYYQQRLDDLIRQLSHHVSKGVWDGTPSYMTPARIYEADYFAMNDIAKIIADFFDDLFRDKAGNLNKTHWIDDTPYTILHIPELLDIFPNLKFIHVFRDLRDVLASHMKFAWGGDDPIVIARRLANIMKRWFELRKQVEDSKYVELCLEKTVESPQESFKELCSFICLEFNSQLSMGLSEIDFKRLHSGRWKKELSPKIVEKIMPYLEPYLKAYGYEI